MVSSAMLLYAVWPVEAVLSAGAAAWLTKSRKEVIMWAMRMFFLSGGGQQSCHDILRKNWIWGLLKAVVCLAYDAVDRGDG